MRPVSVFANDPGSQIGQLRGDLHGRWRQATRAVMILLSAHGLPPAQIAELLDCHPATVRRWIGRFNAEGAAGLADRPRCGRPRLGGRRLAGRIAALLARPGPWTLPRIRRYLGWPRISARTLYRRVRLVAIWRRPKLTARGDPDRDHVVAQIVGRLIELPRRSVVLAEDETHLNLLPHVRAIPWSDWIALPENDSAAAGPISCIADDDRGLDIVTWVNLMLPGEVIQPGLCHLRRRPDSYWTDWEMIDFVEGGFNPDIAPVLAYGGGGEDLNLFAVATDNTVWHSMATKDGWSEWLSLGDPGAPVAGIAAIEDAAGQLNLFAIRQDNVVTATRQEGQAGAWWAWTGLPINTDPITSYAVILDAENCLNLFLGRPGNQGIDIFRQQEGPDSAFVSGPSLPALPI
jgi:transposase